MYIREYSPLCLALAPAGGGPKRLGADKPPVGRHCLGCTRGIQVSTRGSTLRDDRRTPKRENRSHEGVLPPSRELRVILEIGRREPARRRTTSRDAGTSGCAGPSATPRP